MNKKDLSERDICTKFITPAVVRAGWDLHLQIREEVSFTAGRVIVRGKVVKRGESKRADYILYYKPNLPLAIIEAKDNNSPVGGGMQQALLYGEALQIPFVYSSNGDGFLEHDRTGKAAQPERALGNDEFPSPVALWRRYCQARGIDAEAERVVTQDYYSDGSGKEPRYYQVNAVNRVVEAVAAKQDRILLVMATGTGKTYTAFQIIWRLWKAGVKKRILFLADRNILVDQTRTNDFKPFGGAMTKITNRKVDKSFEIYLALYQAISGSDESKDIFKQFSRDFFDLVIVDECHRGSAADNSAWREILEYFQPATQIGLTATPKETEDVSTSHYFGEPVYTYSLKQGIEDGFLAPYKVVRYDLDKDLAGWRPTRGKRDKHGIEIEDRVYEQADFDRTLVLEQRTTLVARKITDYLRATGDRHAKTIVFCDDIDHAERMRQALVNENPDLCAFNRKYVMRITGDNPEGKAELDNFIHPEERYPVLVTTSKLMSTGVDAQTCKVIALDQTIRSMSEFKQIVGRGTRLREDFGKMYFTILDFKSATEHFADPEFDDEPEQIYIPKPGDPPAPPEDLDPDAAGGEAELPAEGSGDPTPLLPGEGGDEAPDPEEPIDPLQPISAARMQHRRKYVVADVSVAVLQERVQYIGKDGKLISESVREHFTGRSLEAYTIRVPPTAEQKRIVAKVDQLMALCDELEAKQTRKRDVGDRLTKAALGALTSAEGPEELQHAWGRLAMRFTDLINQAETTRELRSAIFLLALRGSLSAAARRVDVADDDSARFSQHKSGLTGDPPFGLPEGWVWTRLEDIVEFVTDGDHQPPPKAPAGVPFLTIGNVTTGRLDFSHTRFVPRTYFDKLDQRRVPRAGDILYTVVGATYGRAVPVDEEREFCVQRHVAIIRPNGSCERDYLLLFLRSPLAYSQATAAITGTAQPTVPLRPLRRFLVPLPPRSVQRQIVTDANRFMKLCDELESKLRARDEKAAKLAAALVAEAIA